VALVILFSVLRTDKFMTLTNAEIILEASAIPAILAIGVTIPLAMGDFDLSIGALASFCGIVIGSLLGQHGIATVPALLLVGGLGATVGLINGLIVTRLGLSAFIATLAMGSILTGATFAVSGGTNLYQNFPSSFVVLGSVTPTGISIPVLVAAAIAAICWFLLSATRAGRSIYATGSNPDAATYAGIPVRTYRLLGFVVSSSAAAVAGILLTAQSSAAYVNAGDGFLIPAYAAAFIGAATFRPGVFKVPGTLVGILFTSVLFSGLTFIGVQSYLQNILTGAVLIAAIALSVRARRTTR
jgi:ribose transport system permease protein